MASCQREGLEAEVQRPRLGEGKAGSLEQECTKDRLHPGRCAQWGPHLPFPLYYGESKSWVQALLWPRESTQLSERALELSLPRL